MKSIQVYKNSRKAIPIDSELYHKVKILAAHQEVSIKSLVEAYIIEGLKDETIQN